MREFVAEKVRTSRGDMAVGDGDSILLSGLLNSVTIVEIILFVGQEFELDTTASDVQIEDFDSIDSICALLDRHCQPVARERS